MGRVFCYSLDHLSASAAILRALTVQRLYYQRDTQRNIISFLTKPYFLQGNTDPEYLVGEISKSNILSHNTPLLAGYPSANISKQKVRRMRFSGLLRPRMTSGCFYRLRGKNIPAVPIRKKVSTKWELLDHFPSQH